MTDRTILFNNTIRAIAGILARLSPNAKDCIVIRDIYGRIRIGVNADEQYAQQTEKLFGPDWDKLGVYGKAQGKRVLSRDDFLDPDSIFNSTDILEYRVPDTDLMIRILDRQIVGQNWTRHHHVNGLQELKVPRIVFYGLKGGVGRSAAMAILSYHMASKGRNVLLIDFDLESPGLSGLMLPPDRLAEFGVVDWFIEDAVGQGGEILPRMVSLSPLSQAEGVSGRIEIAAAFGMNEPAYLSKLSRVYADVQVSQGQIERFPERIVRLVRALEEQVTPDIILIDSRAGLHDLAAVSVMSLASKALLFAVDSSQTWQGYRLLFTHWQFHPQIAREVRERLAIVDTLFPETNQEQRAKTFLEHSYDLFSSTLYDEMAPGTDDESSIVFNFDPNDREAPHYPLRVRWNPRFQEFSSDLLSIKTITSDKLITPADIESAYGDFLSGIDLLLEGIQV